MNKLKPLLALPILGLLFIAYACTDAIEPVLEDELEEVVIDLDVQTEPYLIEYLDSTLASGNEIIFEEQEIEVPVEVIEVKTVKGELIESIESEWQTLKDHPSVKSTFTKEGIEILEIPNDLVTEKPVVTVKGVKRSNN